jgi:hypothetical protein
MPIIESSKIKIVSRSTYDNSSYVKESDVVYFVIEPVANGQQYLSLYVGTDKQTDIIDIGDLLENANPPITPGVIITENDIPPSLITTINKLYYWEDTTLGVYKGFIKNKSNEILPLYGTPVWKVFNRIHIIYNKHLHILMKGEFIMNDIFKEFIVTFLTVLATGVATCLIKLLNAKIESIAQTTEDEKKLRFLNWVENDVIVKCINTTTQTYVQALKEQDKFTAESQRIAMAKTVTSVLNVLTKADNELLAEYVDDVTTWITTRIEAYMHESKKLDNRNNTEKE